MILCGTRKLVANPRQVLTKVGGKDTRHVTVLFMGAKTQTGSEVIHCIECSWQDQLMNKHYLFMNDSFVI